MEDHITTHEDAYGKMKELCFPDHVCTCGRVIELYPQVIRSYELIDSCSLTDDQDISLRSGTMDEQGRPASYEVVKSKLKGLFGREAKAIRNSAGGTGPDHHVKEASEKPSSSTGGDGNVELLHAVRERR